MRVARVRHGPPGAFAACARVAGTFLFVSLAALVPELLTNGFWSVRKVVVGQDSLTARFKVGDGPPMSVVRFMPDGHLATATSSGVIRVWDWASGHQDDSFSDESGITGLAVSRDGRTMIVGHAEGILTLWDLPSRSMVKRWQGHSEAVHGLDIRRDGAVAATGSDDGTVKLWSLSSGDPVATLTGHASWVGGVEFSPDGKLLLSASADSTLRIWDVATGATLHVLRGHDAWVRSAVFVSGGSRVLSGGYDEDLRLWDVQTGDTLRVMHGKHGQVYGVASSDDGKWALAIDSGGAVGLWDWTAGSEKHAFRTAGPRDPSTVCGDLSPDGHFVAAAERWGDLYVWDLRPATGGGS